MSSDQPASGAAPAFPNYFELFQNIASPFMGQGGNNPASNAAAMMMAAMDPKEVERKTRELETVLMWLKAQVGVVEMSIQTLEYQKTFLSKMAANPGAGNDAKATTPAPSPDLAELAKTAAAMNPALWAWNLMQKPVADAVKGATYGVTSGAASGANNEEDSKSAVKKPAAAKRKR